MSHIVNRDIETNDQNRNPRMYNYGHLKPVKQMPVNNSFSHMGYNQHNETHRQDRDSFLDQEQILTKRR